MKTYIALFRGINVGKTSSLRMKELVAILERLGFQNVRTYIQSGNVALQHPDEDTSRLSSKVSAAIKKTHGFELHVVLLTSDELIKAMAGNPFPEAEAEPQTLHLGFLASAPVNPDLKGLERIKTDSERFLLKGSTFYLHAPDGIGRSKLAASAEKLLGVPMTDRNWRTVCKIADMVKEIK